MADFVRHNWVCGETITADRLNNIEGGVEEALDCCGSSLVVTMTEGGDKEVVYSLDKTYRQIAEAINDGQTVYAIGNNLTDYGTFTTLAMGTAIENGSYLVTFANGMVWGAPDPDDPLQNITN